jgi:hypothetical protein
MALQHYGLLLIALTGTLGQVTVNDPRTTETGSTITATEHATPTGSYLSYASQVTLGTSLGSISSVASFIGSGNFSATQSVVSQTTDTRTYLSGTAQSTVTNSGNFSATASSTPTATVTNTRACNNYAEFCNRKYSNITEISCHNSPFITANNLAANQEYDVTLQLDDGVRFLQAQIQWPTNGTEPHFCHTSCDILDAGPITEWLTKVKTWVAKHPYDVVTILLGNGN